MALEKSGKLEATNLLLYIILTLIQQCCIQMKLLLKLEYKNKSGNIQLVQVLKIGFGKLQFNQRLGKQRYRRKSDPSLHPDLPQANFFLQPHKQFSTFRDSFKLVQGAFCGRSITTFFGNYLGTKLNKGLIKVYFLLQKRLFQVKKHSDPGAMNLDISTLCCNFLFIINSLIKFIFLQNASPPSKKNKIKMSLRMSLRKDVSKNMPPCNFFDSNSN